MKIYNNNYPTTSAMQSIELTCGNKYVNDYEINLSYYYIYILFINTDISRNFY